MEVLNAHEFKFLQKDDNDKRNRLVDNVKMNFNVDYMLGLNRTYEMDFQLKVKYDAFFRQSLELFSFDDAMGVLLDEKNVFVKMATYRES